MIAATFAGPCTHVHLEPVLSGGGVRIAERCTRCLRVVAFRPCRQCAAEMRAPHPLRRYCRKACKSKAYRARKKKEKCDARS